MTSRRRGPLAAFVRDRRGSSAVEFAIVAMPFIVLLLGILQLGIYFMTQSALDSGVVQTADSLVNTYYSGTTPPTMTPASLKTLVIAKSGGLIANSPVLSVELRLLANLAAAPVAIGNTVDTSVAGSVLALRAQASVPSVVPGMGTLAVRSSALVRRQGQ